MLPLASQKVPSPFPAPGKLPSASPARPGIPPAGWMSQETLLCCLPVAGGEKRREGREAEAGENRPSLVTEVLTPPRSCVGSGMDG